MTLTVTLSHTHHRLFRDATNSIDTQVRLLLLAALCGEHLLLLGPPGTAKSELSRRLAGLTGGRYYERLLTRFSVPEELFGPLSMRGAHRNATSAHIPTRKCCVCFQRLQLELPRVGRWSSGKLNESRARLVQHAVSSLEKAISH